MKITELFNKIRSTSKTADKVALLSSNFNDTVKQIMQDTYTSARYYVKKFNTDLPVGKKTLDGDYTEVHAVLTKLASRELTGNDAIAAVENLISGFMKDDQAVIINILDRNLKIGLSKDTVRKLDGNTIEAKFEVTLAKNIENVKGVNPLDGTYYASRKLDGCVSADTLVELENNKKITIKEIVDKKLQCKVKSYDFANNTVVYKNITDFMHNDTDVDKTQKEWFEIETADGKYLKITANDTVYVKDKGWTRIDSLIEGDEILVD